MDVEAERRAVIAAFEASRLAILDAIEGLDEMQLSERSIDGWSVKDHLAHLTQWHELRWLDMVRIAAGYASAVNGTDEEEEVFNRMTVRWRAELSWQQTLWDWHSARDRVLDMVRRLPPEQLEVVASDVWPLHTAHEDQHAGWLRAWRQREGL